MNVRFTRLMALFGFAMLIVQPVAASDDNPWGKPGPQKTQTKQRGKESGEPKPWEVRPWSANPLETKPLQPNPRESRPWEEASEEVRPKDATSREERSVESRRRA